MKTGRDFILLAIFLIAMAAAAHSAAPGPVTLQEKDRGKTITLQVGEKLLLYLRNPGSGGYNTNPPIFNATVLELVSQKKMPRDPQKPPLPGDFGQFYYEWAAKGRG